MSEQLRFDPRCLELANYFTQDYPRLAGKEKELAQAIQDAIEDWFTEQGDVE